jgi:hypothetical protein
VSIEGDIHPITVEIVPLARCEWNVHAQRRAFART